MAVEKWMRITELPDAPYDNNGVMVNEDTVDQDQVNLTHTAEEVAGKIYDNFAYPLSNLETTSKVPTGAVNEVLSGISGVKTFIGQSINKTITFSDSFITTSSLIFAYAEDEETIFKDEVISTGSVTYTLSKDSKVKVVIY